MASDCQYPGFRYEQFGHCEIDESEGGCKLWGFWTGKSLTFLLPNSHWLPSDGMEPDTIREIQVDGEYVGDRKDHGFTLKYSTCLFLDQEL